MNIELKNVKHFEAGSEETNCFVATIYVDGKRAGEAKNEGHGGPTFIYPRDLEDKLTAYAKTLPVDTFEMNGEIHELDNTADSIIDKLLERWMVAKQLKRELAKRLLFTAADKRGVFQTKTMLKPQMEKYLAMGHETLREKMKATRVLNLMPFEEALEVFLAEDKAVRATR